MDMFVVGLAVGAFVMMVLGTISIGIMTRQITKERERDGDKSKVDPAKLYEFWANANAQQKENNAILSDILMVIDK